MSKRPGSRRLIKTFWERVTKTQGCWIWNGYTTKLGYGLLTVNSITTTAHRFSWELLYGPVSLGLNVLHKCDNPPCVRPDHLFLGTQKDNIDDMASKGRGGNHKPRGGSKYHRPGGVPHSITRELVKLHLAAGLNQSEVARKIGISRQRVSQILLE